jgi:peptidoglycan/LPS O-acetylase OafA/YrhL
MTAHPAPKLVCFEAIRGLAALMVVLSHIIVGFWPALMYKEGPQWDAAPRWFHALVRFPCEKLWDGSLAVAIFFVLSGFVLSLTFFQKGSTKALGSAALRRYPRLMFPVAASVLLTFVLMKTGAICNQAAAQAIHQNQGITYDPQSRPGESHHWLLVWYNFCPDFVTALHQSTWVAFTGLATYNLVLWTMPIELIGSFLVYSFLALFGGFRRRWLLYAICCGVVLVRDDALPVTGSYYLLNFVLGMALCDLWVYNQRTWQKSLALGPALGLALLGFFAVKIKLLAALIVIGATAASPRLQQLLSARWLAFLGRLSFGVYLVHMMILASLGCGTYMFLCGNLGWPHLSGCLATALAIVLGTILAAWAFYHLVDRPTIALTRRLDSWLFGPKPESRTLSFPPQSFAGEARAA